MSSRFSPEALVDSLRFRRQLVGTFMRDGKLVRKYQKVRRFPGLGRYLKVAAAVLLAALVLTTAALFLREQRSAQQESGEY